VESVTEKLRGIDKSKAGGPDGLPAWLLKTYADIIALAVTDVLNSSFLECKIPNCCRRQLPILYMLPDFTRPSLFNGVMYSRSRSGLACPVRCRITGGHCTREVCEVRGIKMLTLEMTTCVRSILGYIVMLRARNVLITSFIIDSADVIYTMAVILL
jgi:hypothetical protein